MLIPGSLLAAAVAGFFLEPRWTLQRTALDVQEEEGTLFYSQQGERNIIDPDEVVPADEAELTEQYLENLTNRGESPAVREQIIVEEAPDAKIGNFYRLEAVPYWGPWSLFPAAIAILACLVTREPLTSLLAGIIAGGLILAEYDVVNEILLPSLASENAAGMLLLNLWFLGGLLGIWSKTGAAQAFADFATRHLVRGPRSARLVAWAMGVLFFQGGVMSVMLVGSTVKPVADREKVSHEELSYIVDSTASPISVVLPFNVWPAYVQALIFIPGVSFLATEMDRLAFFFKSVPFSFYGIFAVLSTLLLSFDKLPFMGKAMTNAISRARETGALDGPDAAPLSAEELETSDVPAGYHPHVMDFAVPVLVLIGIARGTFLWSGTPLIRIAFAVAVVIAALMAMSRGLSLQKLMDGVAEGLKGVVVATIILMLAITIGNISQQTGGGIYMVELLGDAVPYWLLPLALLVLTMVISFSTGTSWGTYAVVFPLAMPLAWAVAQGPGVSHPEFYLMICFATALNGSLYGDQCSPISDTTVLTAMTTGADLMDHVRTQIPPATAAAVLAAICWTVTVLLFA